ncbi:MAG: glycosyltransferase family 4 protein, partial [Caulobacter sp.]
MSKTIALLTTEYPPYPGGIATYTWNIAAALAAAGHAPTVYVIGPAPASPPPAGVSVVHVPEPVYSHKRLPFITLKVLRALKARPADIVFACDYRLIMALGWWKRPGKVAGVHGTDVRSKILTLLGETRLYRALNGFDRVVANSAFTKAELLRHHPYVAPDAVITAPLGVDAFWRTPVAAQERDRLLAPLNLPAGNALFISIGRIERRKGQLATVRAVAALPDDLRRRTTYLVVGREVEADYAGELREAAAEAVAAGADVRLVGSLDGDVLR